MPASRMLRPLAPVLAAFASGFLLLDACRNSDRPTAPAVSHSADVVAAQTSTVIIGPTGDTYLNIDAQNHAAEITLNVYTWQDAQRANAIVMTFDLGTIPPGSTITSAILNLNLVESDATADPTYTVTAHKIVNKKPVITLATGYTYDGTHAWTANGCCFNGVPLAQADIAAPVDTRQVDKTPGFKQWDVTSVVQGWLTDPAANFGLLLNSDASKPRDRYRSFSSSEDPVAGNRPYLTVTYDAAPPPPPPPAGDTLVFAPLGDTFLNVDANSYAADTLLILYTWPDNSVANAIVMKFDLASIPAGTTISRATLNLDLAGGDASTDPTYTATVHRIVNKNPDVVRATGYTYDGVNAWSAPLAQADIGPSVDTKAVDKAEGFKQWNVTAIVQGWLSNPSTNFGLLVNSDPTKLRDRYRMFRSSEYPVVGRRPFLKIVTGPGAPPPPPPEATLGQWSAVFPAPIVQLHLHLLPNGRVLSWGRNGDPQVWDPATGGFTTVPAPAWLFCAGHDFLPDGRLFVAGGHISDDHGLANANVFDAASAWQVEPAMAQGRWYPTATTLADGQVLVMAGRDEAGAIVTIPEVWTGSGWRRLTTADQGSEYYPRNFLAPDGRVFYAGEDQPSRWLDVNGTGSTTDGPRRNFTGGRGYGSAVMYAPGKILYVGGGDPPTKTAEIIDLNQPNPAWTYTGSMTFARRQMNATLLPTGEVLVTGGTSGSGFTNPVGAVHAAELWNPATGTWTTLASNAVTRVYHSATLLLPDGRVLHTGSGDGGGAADERNYELYSPPYLFRGARPTITSPTPGAVGYGQTVFVETPNGSEIAKVTFIRLGSVTHAFNMGQRLVPLSFGQGAGGLSVAIPASRTTAPPGPYMLFLVNANGVPSEGRIMLLR